MANKRFFKKNVEALGASICNDMMITYYNVDGVDRDAIAGAIEKVLAATAKAKDNSNVYFDKGPKAFESQGEYSKAKTEFFKTLFNKIEDEFTEEIDVAIKEYNAAIPANVKELNKKLIAAE